MNKRKRHDTPFGNALASRHAVAVILSFTGRGPEVAQLMQELSKKSRCFYITQEGLPGFLTYFNPKIWLNQLKKKTELVESIGKKEVERVIENLKDKHTVRSQREWLKNETFLYWMVLKHAGCKDEYEAFVKKSKDSVIWYSFYANFHLKCWFDDLKREGSLK